MGKQTPYVPFYFGRRPFASVRGLPMKGLLAILLGFAVAGWVYRSYGSVLGTSAYLKSSLVKDVFGFMKTRPGLIDGAPLPLDAPLSQRLKVWDSSLNMELAEWTLLNSETCTEARTKKNWSKGFLDRVDYNWFKLPARRIRELRTEMINYLQLAEKQGRLGPNAWGKGRGLVFTAGNVDTFRRVALTLILLEEHFGVRMPVEIFSFPGEKPDAEAEAILAEHNVTHVLVESAIRDGARTKNYHLKATAIIRSSFREVLYLDSDNMPYANIDPLAKERKMIVQDGTSVKLANRSESDPRAPSGIWESKAYKRLGVMFWPDYWKTAPHNPMWAVLGVQCRDEWEQEAGQLLVNKKYHLDALLLAEWMMDSSRYKFWYDLSDGDKDMFRFAFLALRKRWAVAGRFVGAGAFSFHTPSGFCGHSMIGHDHQGRPMFVHANLLKQIPYGFSRGNTWKQTRTVVPFSNGVQAERLDDMAENEPWLLPDLDVDADMLANCDDEGRGITTSPNPAVRRRAVAERGLGPFFHGGSISALCVDVDWEDPRSDEEIAKHTQQARARLGLEANSTEPVDIEKTITSDGIEISWASPLAVTQWSKDPRFARFDENYYDAGGYPSAAGF